jgi:signal transduction histidine kinase
MKRSLRFKASARLQSILSRELVSDPNVALLEFVKNAYDATATQVSVTFELDDDPLNSVIWIADNGDGMDLASFERDWMRPGFSKKAEYKPTPGRRVPVGEKGLGRLAAGRLGDGLEVYTRRSNREPWLHVKFKWSAFDDMTRNLDEIPIPIDDEHVPAVKSGHSGTVVRISGLRLNWNARVPGRKVPGRSDTRLGRLRQDLEVLLLPLTAADQSFNIVLEHNSNIPDDEAGPVTAPEIQTLGYKFTFDVKTTGSQEASFTVARSKAIASEAGIRRTTKGKIKLASILNDIKPSSVGSFSGSFFYAPKNASRLRELRAPIGVQVYRDNVRVDPYGEEGDDWLGARARKAARQGYAAIQPNALYGAVEISKKDNPNLVAMANREGLIENDAYDAFITICRALFAEFEAAVYEEIVKPNWTSLDEKRQDLAKGQQEFAFMLARTAVHAVRQPVAGAGAELDRLQHVIDSASVKQAVQNQLQELHDRTLAHLNRIEDIVARMLDVFDFEPEPTEFELVSLVGDVVKTVSDTSAKSHKIDVKVDSNGEQAIVRLPRDLVEHALVELIENAIHADRGTRRKGKVDVVVHREQDRVMITVTDDGHGVPDEIVKHLFTRTQSTRGHIGFGLILTRQMLRLIRGDVELTSTGDNGASFSIMLPLNERERQRDTSDASGRG